MISLTYRNQSVIQSPPLKQNVLGLQPSKVQQNPSAFPIVSAPIKQYNRPRLTVYSQASSNNKDSDKSSVPIGSILTSSNDEIEIKRYSVYVKSRRKTYNYSIIKACGQYCFLLMALLGNMIICHMI